MRETHATIERATRIGPTLARLEVATDFAPGSIRPGQYLLARVNTTWEPYLRARWEPVRIAGGLLHIDRPPDDIIVPGTVVDILGPCGRPIPIRHGAERFLLIVQDTVPSPLIAFVEAVVGAGGSVTMALDATAQRYPMGELPPQVEILRIPQAWRWTDRVDAVKWADQVVALSAPHQAAEHYKQIWKIITQLRAPVPEGFALGCFTAPTPCGVGACGACLVRGRHGDIHACTDGPALDLGRLAF